MKDKVQLRPQIGDLVRIKQTGGRVSDQRYKLTAMCGRFLCAIQQWPSTAPAGMKTAEELFDLSLLVVDNSGPQLLAGKLPRVG